jgi:hypothetical protein
MRQTLRDGVSVGFAQAHAELGQTSNDVFRRGFKSNACSTQNNGPTRKSARVTGLQQTQRHEWRFHSTYIGWRIALLTEYR